LDKVGNRKNYRSGEKKWNVNPSWEEHREAISQMAHELNILPKTAVLLYNRGLCDAASA